MTPYRSTDDTEHEQLFILGAPRSGTTFLASLLDETRFGKPVESHFVTKYFSRLRSYGDLQVFANFDRLLRDIGKERAVMQWQLDVDERDLHDRLRGRAAGVRYADIVDELFLARRAASGRNAWGDKTPHYLGDVAVLDELFPRARYLYIVRDGRDVALSLLRKDWGPNNVYAAAEYWSRLNTPNATMKRLRASGRLHYLRYEDLSEDVVSHVREIGAFLGENFSEGEIARLSGTVRSNNSYKWKRELSRRQIRVFEGVARDTLVRFGYEVGSSLQTVPSIQRAVYRLHDKLVWSRFMLKTNVVHGFQIRFLGKEPFAD